MRLCKRMIFVKRIIVIFIPVVSVLSISSNSCLQCVSSQLSLPESLQPFFWERLWFINAGRLYPAVIVFRLAKQISPDITVINDIRHSIRSFIGEVPCIIDRKFIFLFWRIFCCNQDNPIRSTWTVDGCWSRIFQYGHAFYIIRIQHGRITFYTVYQYQRTTARSDRRYTTDIIRSRLIGLTVD